VSYNLHRYTCSSSHFYTRKNNERTSIIFLANALSRIIESISILFGRLKWQMFTIISGEYIQLHNPIQTYYIDSGSFWSQRKKKKLTFFNDIFRVIKHLCFKLVLPFREIGKKQELEKWEALRFSNPCWKVNWTKTQNWETWENLLYWKQNWTLLFFYHWFEEEQ
jgi:hypothetical protein